MLMMIIIVMIGTVSGELALSGYVYSQITLNICHNLSTKSRHWSNASICYLIIVPRVDINKILASQDEVQQPQQMVRSDGGEAVRIDIGRSWWWWVGGGWGGMSYEEGSTAAVDRDRWRIALLSLSLDMASEHNSYKHWVVCFALRLSDGRSNSVEALPSIVVNSRRSSLVSANSWDKSPLPLDPLQHSHQACDELLYRRQVWKTPTCGSPW